MEFILTVGVFIIIVIIGLIFGSIGFCSEHLQSGFCSTLCCGSQTTGKPGYREQNLWEQETQTIYSSVANNCLSSESVWSKWAHVCPNLACYQAIVSKHFKTSKSHCSSSTINLFNWNVLTWRSCSWFSAISCPLTMT